MARQFRVRKAGSSPQSPELIAPQLMVSKHHPQATSRGYWFVTPHYVTNQRLRAEPKGYILCQTRAHTYDVDGQLIWSGACKYDNRNISHTGLWISTARSTSHFGWDINLLAIQPLSQRTMSHPQLCCRTIKTKKPSGSSSTFPRLSRSQLQPDGTSILLSWLWKEERDLAPYGKTNREVLHGGFRELDLATNEPSFDWDTVANNVTRQRIVLETLGNVLYISNLPTEGSRDIIDICPHVTKNVISS